MNQTQERDSCVSTRGPIGDYAMNTDGKNPSSSQSDVLPTSRLFDDWIDPIESGVRARVRDWIEALVHSELDTRGGRNRRPCDPRRPAGARQLPDSAGATPRAEGARRRLSACRTTGGLADRRSTASFTCRGTAWVALQPFSPSSLETFQVRRTSQERGESDPLTLRQRRPALQRSYAGDWVTRLIRRRGEPAF